MHDDMKMHITLFFIFDFLKMHESLHKIIFFFNMRMYR